MRIDIFKNIEIDHHLIARRKDDYAKSWGNSLQHQLRDLPDFERVFAEVIEQVRVYET